MTQEAYDNFQRTMEAVVMFMGAITLIFIFAVVITGCVVGIITILTPSKKGEDKVNKRAMGDL